MTELIKYQVIVSKSASGMLVSHAMFLSQVNRDAAERFIKSFEKASKSLDTMPERCPWLSGDYIPRHVYRFMIFEKRYMIVFQIVDDIVYVDYVIDCRQDYRWLIR